MASWSGCRVVDGEDFEIEICRDADGFGFELSMFGRIAKITEVHRPPRNRLATASHSPRTHFALTLHLCSAPRQGGRAEAAGLQTWDRIKSVNGAPLSESRDMLGEKRCL